MAASADDVALAVDAPTEAAFDHTFLTAGCTRAAPRHAHRSAFGLRNLMYAPDDRHDVAVLNIADLERLDERRDSIRHRGVERRWSWWCTVRGTVLSDVVRSPFLVICEVFLIPYSMLQYYLALFRR